MTDRRYLAEIHDVRPGMRPELDELVTMLPADARDRVAYSVVPNWQDQGAIGAEDPCAAELRARPGTMVLHGWTHSLGPDLVNWLLYGHDNRSEFRRLSEDEAARRLALGREALSAALGQAPEWFCAPRWQLGPQAGAALRKAGFRGHLGRRAITDFARGRLTWPALNFDEGERAWRTALANRLREPALRRLLRRGRPFRIVLHPNDALEPATRAQIAGFTAALVREGWRAVGLDEALADLPGARAA